MVGWGLPRLHRISRQTFSMKGVAAWAVVLWPAQGLRLTVPAFGSVPMLSPDRAIDRCAGPNASSAMAAAAIRRGLRPRIGTSWVDYRSAHARGGPCQVAAKVVSESVDADRHARSPERLGGREPDDMAVIEQQPAIYQAVQTAPGELVDIALAGPLPGRLPWAAHSEDELDLIGGLKHLPARSVRSSGVGHGFGPGLLRCRGRARVDGAVLSPAGYAAALRGR